LKEWNPQNTKTRDLYQFPYLIISNCPNSEDEQTRECSKDALVGSCDLPTSSDDNQGSERHPDNDRLLVPWNDEAKSTLGVNRIKVLPTRPADGQIRRTQRTIRSLEGASVSYREEAV